MLNVEKLMASELVAVSSPKIIAAALFVWCRAWKQIPAASLPDDDRVIAAFARLSLGSFRKHRDQILHGFIKCCDGRLYHRFLSQEATRAYARKLAYRAKLSTDSKRLQKWRHTRKETRDKTRCETDDATAYETRYVAERQGQGQGQLLRKKENILVEPVGSPRSKPSDDGFDQFWNLCPKKVQKGRARKAWIKALLRTSQITICEAMAKYALARAGQDDQFTLHPATWLNSECWLDQPPQTNGAAPPIASEAQLRLKALEDVERENLKKMGVI
jgi:hypothetical protein